MPSGFEVAGLVLAILPLVVEAAKVYSDGVDSILDVTLKSRYDENLEDFYDDFYIEMVRLGDLTRQVKNAILSEMNPATKIPDSTKVLLDWQGDARLEQALRSFFVSEGRFEEFSVYCGKILRVLEEFVDDKTTQIAAVEQSDHVMYSKLQSLADERKRGATTSSLFERFRFSRHHKKRERFISNLRKWTERFERLMEKVAKGTGGTEILDERKQTRIVRVNPPSSQARRLVTSLYRVLCHHNPCSCAESHQFQLGLGTLDDMSKSDVTIDCFVSHVDVWQEANITLTTANIPSQPFNTVLERLCSALQRCIQGFSLGLLLQDINGKQTLWQLRPRPRRLRVLESSDPISLQDLLASPTKLNLAEKRRLSLIVACSLLLYHESPWLTHGWLKKDLFFFFKSEDEPDIEHPFLSAGFDSQSLQNREDPFHRNPQILALAILLIEIHNEKPIEWWRTKKDLAKITVNTDMMVAERVIEKMDDCPFRDAIRSCLRMDWISESKPATLDDEEVRLGYILNVIAPLEQEVEWEKRPLPVLGPRKRSG